MRRTLLRNLIHATKDMPNETPDDLVEAWGRRIMRGQPMSKQEIRERVRKL